MQRKVRLKISVKLMYSKYINIRLWKKFGWFVHIRIFDEMPFWSLCATMRAMGCPFSLQVLLWDCRVPVIGKSLILHCQLL